MSRGRADEAGPYLKNAGTTAELPGRSARLRMLRDEAESGSAAALSLTESMRPEDAEPVPDSRLEISGLEKIAVRCGRRGEAARHGNAELAELADHLSQ